MAIDVYGPTSQRRHRGRTSNALLDSVIDFHRPVGGAKIVRKGKHDCPLIKTEEKPAFLSLPILIKDVPINQLFKIARGFKNICKRIRPVYVTFESFCIFNKKSLLLQV